MTRRSAMRVAFCAFWLAAGLVRADIESQMQQEAAALHPVLQDAGQLLVAGQVDQADQKILDTFPEKSRTAMQALLLGNVLFKQDPVISYALHKRAAKELGDEPLVQLEWGMEQHRAGEYAGAAESYRKFLKAQPTFGPVHGLLAECLIRTGKTREAADEWTRSEQGGGSLEQFESWDCDVHTHDRPDHDRQGFYQSAKAGDAAAAENLIALDSNSPIDWWNAGPKDSYLASDLAMLKATKLKDESRRAEIECAAKCAQMQASESGDVAATLRRSGFLLDEKVTLPRNGKLLSAMVSAALDRQALTADEARAKWGERILAQAKASRDAATFNAAAHLYLGTEKLPEIDQLGWDATGDERFAASLLVGLVGKGNLKLDDPRLVRAAKQFPENSEIARLVVLLTRQAGKPLEPALVNGIKAEYSHFSVGSPLLSRPSAATLRAYFAELSKIQ
jgi:hypothetical protein